MRSIIVLILCSVACTTGTAQLLMPLRPFSPALAVSPLAKVAAVPVPLPLVARDQYTKSFGFFCRQELKMQQAHIPLTFRLGSMEQCNRLEQKPGYR